jgi:hydroxyethylthiazole kinase
VVSLQVPPSCTPVGRPMNTRPALFSGAIAAEQLHQLRRASPLIHCITNDVVQSFTANVLLALGASPAMVIDPREAAQFASMASALLVNVGTLTAAQCEAMLAAIAAANQAQTPWVLDPVAVGALQWRSEFCQQLLTLHPCAIRGNASEIMALSGLPASGRGVDSNDASLAALPAAQQLAREYGAVVAVTGEIDYVTDGQRSLAIAGGHPMMTRVVGTGCALSAVVAAFVALEGDKLSQVASACRVMSCAGERACRLAAGPGSFTPHFLDNLYLLDVGALQ